ncbi:MAG: hypothetical protein QM704_02500 [Anaeromyxobacteraceae bacterium]
MVRRIAIVALVVAVLAIVAIRVLHLDERPPFASAPAPAPVATAAAPAPPPTAPVPAPPQATTAPPEAPAAPATVAAPVPVPARRPTNGAGVSFESADAADRRSREPVARPPELRDVTPPEAPADLLAEPDGPNVRLSWPASTDDVGVERYEVLRDGQVFVSTSGPSATDEAAPPLRKLCYSVVARDEAGNRSRPSRTACLKLADLVPPTPPTVVQARSTSETSVALSWSGAADAGGVVGYDVVRGGLVVATPDSPRTADSGLLAGRTYCWTIRARDAAGNVSKDSAEACATVRDQTPPAPPPGLVAAPAAPDRLAVGWQAAVDNVGVDHYEVLRDGKLILRTAATKLTGTEAGLVPSTSYCYTVVAVDAAGNRSRQAGPACARTADPGTPAGPTDLALAASARSASAVVLRWDGSPEPGVVYTVYWDGHKRIGATPRNEYTVVGLKSGEHRCFRVSAVDPAGRESPSSLEACTGAPKL